MHAVGVGAFRGQQRAALREGALPHPPKAKAVFLPTHSLMG